MPAFARTTPNAKNPEKSANATIAAGKNKEINEKADQRAKLKTTVESQAGENIAKLRAALERAPASAKPALEEALRQSETDYQRAIDALNQPQ